MNSDWQLEPFAQPAFPTTRLDEAADVIASETGDLRAIPTLPLRGVRSDSIAHSLSMLPDLAIDIGPRAWRIHDRPQRMTRRVWDTAEADLDQLEALWGQAAVLGHVVGPYSLAASIELRNGHRMISDYGALRDLHAMLIEGAAAYVQQLQRRFGAPVALHLYEPALPEVIAGALAGTHDFDRIAAVHQQDVQDSLAQLLDGIRTHSTPAHIGVALGQNIAVTAPIAQHIGAEVVIIDPHQLVRSKAQGTTFASTEVLDASGMLLGSGVTPAFAAYGVTEDASAIALEPRAQAIQLARLYDVLGLERASLSTAVCTARQTTSGTVLQHARNLGAAVEVTDILRRDAGDL